MNILSVEAIISRAIGESDFAERLIKNFKETLSPYNLSDHELVAIGNFTRKLALARTAKASPRTTIAQRNLGWFWIS